MKSVRNVGVTDRPSDNVRLIFYGLLFVFFYSCTSASGSGRHSLLVTLRFQSHEWSTSDWDKHWLVCRFNLYVFPLFQSGNHSVHQKNVHSQSVQKLQTVESEINFPILKRCKIFGTLNFRRNDNLHRLRPVHISLQIGVTTSLFPVFFIFLNSNGAYCLESFHPMFQNVEQGFARFVASICRNSVAFVWRISTILVQYIAHWFLLAVQLFFDSVQCERILKIGATFDTSTFSSWNLFGFACTPPSLLNVIQGERGNFFITH